MVQSPPQSATKLPPSQHEYAEVIHRLEAGGAMLPDTPENLMQIIGLYKAYAVPMDFYWRDLLYIAERVFLNPFPFFKYFLPKEYLDLHNHYAGDDADLRGEHRRRGRQPGAGCAPSEDRGRLRRHVVVAALRLVRPRTEHHVARRTCDLNRRPR